MTLKSHCRDFWPSHTSCWLQWLYCFWLCVLFHWSPSWCKMAKHVHTRWSLPLLFLLPRMLRPVSFRAYLLTSFSSAEISPLLRGLVGVLYQTWPLYPALFSCIALIAIKDHDWYHYLSNENVISMCKESVISPNKPSKSSTPTTDQHVLRQPVNTCWMNRCYIRWMLVALNSDSIDIFQVLCCIWV